MPCVRRLAYRTSGFIVDNDRLPLLHALLRLLRETEIYLFPFSPIKYCSPPYVPGGRMKVLQFSPQAVVTFSVTAAHYSAFSFLLVLLQTLFFPCTALPSI